MASIRSIDQIENGTGLNVEIISKFNNFFVVINNSYSLKGVLLPINNENKIRLENFINDCQRTENNNIKKKSDEDSLFCIPDSTLSHTASESNVNINPNNEVCNECKRTLKKPSKRKSSNSELDRLTNHGFNERLLIKKNALSRRNTVKGEELATEENKLKDVKEKLDSKKDGIATCQKNMDKSNDKKEEIIIRKTKDRALKTKANEKIIDLCTRKSSKIKIIDVEVKKKVKKEVTVDDGLSNSPIKLSDASIYDFVDEDYESEPIKPLYKENKKSYFIDKSNNAVKIDKRSYKRNLCPKKINSKDDEIHSNPGIMSYDYKGTKFSINNIVWAKIPGYPFWPAHIKSFDNVSASKSQGKRCRINWIGWNQKSFLPLKSLLHFKDHFRVKYSAKFKSQKYKKAIELACKELGLDFHDLTVDLGKKSPASDRNNSSQTSLFSKRKSIDLDDIFTSKNNSKDILDNDMAAQAYSDEDTDEEEKARSALITAESLESSKRRSGRKSSDFDY